MITLCLFLQLGTSAITGLIWFKFIATAIGIIVHNNRKVKENYFYRNLGLNKKELIIGAIAADIGIWILGFTIIVNLTL